MPPNLKTTTRAAARGALYLVGTWTALALWVSILCAPLAVISPESKIGAAAFVTWALAWVGATLGATFHLTDKPPR